MNTAKTSGATTVNSRRNKTRAYSPRRYGQLLAAILPGVIDDQREYDRLETKFNALVDKGEEKLSAEETRVFSLLANLLEDFERRTLPAIPDLKPNEALRFLMEQNDLKQADLEDIFGSQSGVSRALSGSRRISPTHAKQLAGRFKVSAELFI